MFLGIKVGRVFGFILKGIQDSAFLFCHRRAAVCYKKIIGGNRLMINGVYIGSAEKVRKREKFYHKGHNGKHKGHKKGLEGHKENIISPLAKMQVHGFWNSGFKSYASEK